MCIFNTAVQSAVDQIIIHTYTDKSGNYTPNGVRSGKERTDPFHKSLIDAIKHQYPDPKYTFKTEYPITVIDARHMVKMSVLRLMIFLFLNGFSTSLYVKEERTIERAIHDILFRLSGWRTVILPNAKIG